MTTGDASHGKQLFIAAAKPSEPSCSSCHVLADAKSQGTVGPNLDDAKPEQELVIDRVTHGQGVMPSFAGQLSEKQIQDVAAYVADATQG